MSSWTIMALLKCIFLDLSNGFRSVSKNENDSHFFITEDVDKMIESKKMVERINQAIDIVSHLVCSQGVRDELTWLLTTIQIKLLCAPCMSQMTIFDDLSEVFDIIRDNVDIKTKMMVSRMSRMQRNDIGNIDILPANCIDHIKNYLIA